jgi:hypothetical protein
MLGAPGIRSNLAKGQAFRSPKGVQIVFSITGFALDAVGQPVSGATVKVFRTADDTLLATTTSDATGLYAFVLPQGVGGNYLVFYKAGSPDIYGTTLNTIPVQ